MEPSASTGQRVRLGGQDRNPCYSIGNDDVRDVFSNDGKGVEQEVQGEPCCDVDTGCLDIIPFHCDHGRLVL